MAAKIEPFSVLKDAQAEASSPESDVWLSASAGTGKTFVLAARVLRLLLRREVRPDAILCLTFTRAGAAEMAERVHSRLAKWARWDDKALRVELSALGEANGPDDIAHARTLFAKVLEARGGGLRVMTIHAFCQTLLGTFPLEAGLAPGFRAVEGREQAALAASVLGALAEEGERQDARLVAALRALSRRLGEAGTQSFLLRAAMKLDALEGLPEGIEASVRRALDVPAEYDAPHLEAACRDENVDRDGLLNLGAMQAGWGTSTGDKNADRISNWLLGTPRERARELGELRLAWATKAGTIQAKGPKDAGYGALADQLDAWCSELLALAARAALAADIAHALYAARRYARAYADAKQAAGLVDFDDLIGRAVALLQEDGMGAWIAYKLDQATDHILVDEAQDTNQRQWDIVKALAGEFWAGDGAREGVLRTLFTVGDYKQAIFGFQGTDPRHYAAAGEEFGEAARAGGREIVRLSLDRSFRSTPPVLGVVDALLDDLGEDAFGDQARDRHESAKGGPGSVILLPPVRAPEGDDDANDSGAEEGWVPTATRTLADRIATQVRDWLRDGHRLAAQGRALTPGDVMILVRKRGDLAALLVARLQRQGVPVAGVDRLRLAAPLAVKDCLAAMRFAVQPDDDLTLASLLVSPIGGWTQDQLFAVAHLPRKGSLWEAVRASDHPADSLRMMLAMADFVSPYVFLETMLSGEIGARAKLLRRLGNEASDPIDELLNAAMQFEREGVATLQGFLDWFDRGDSEVVRDAGGQGDAVRVMTVHAAKGLQAPLVILADATSDPEVATPRDFSFILDETIKPLPLFRPRSAERKLVEALENMSVYLENQDRREHWRLLYVAMTRAEEQLVIAGSLTQRQKAVPEDSWHAAIERAMMRMGVAEVELPDWGRARVHEVAGRGVKAAAKDPAPTPVSRPYWIDRPAPPEARPPRPLAPSSLGADTVSDPPPSPELRAAAERGRLLHALFERLPGIVPDARRVAAERWLERSAGIADAAERAELADAVLTVLDHPDCTHLFAPDGLAEVPVAGVVDGVVISGTVDRLIVGNTRVDIVDFKTGRRVPANAAAVPDAYKRQMAAYVAVLEGVFPDHAVHAALLYSAAPKLIALTAADLAAHKPGYIDTQQLLPAGG